VDKTKITTSGVSSGAAMAGQLHVIYSASIKGSGIIAGRKGFFTFFLLFFFFNKNSMTIIDRYSLSFSKIAPYLCYEVVTMLASCMLSPTNPFIPLSNIYSKLSNYVSQGLVDDTKYLKDAYVYVFSGSADLVVSASNFFP
jgi:hypothetical protein